MKRLLAEIYLITLFIFFVSSHYEPKSTTPATPLDHVAVLLGVILLSAGAILATLVLWKEYDV